MDPFSSSLQVPDSSSPGPSRPHGSTRPASVQPATTVSPPTSQRKRASHSVVSPHQQHQEEQPAYRDVYSHPAAVEYAAAHPRRTIPKFGPYLLLQTLGEGEFGKVKLGLHMNWGEEVAVKLIRRGNIDSTVRMTKVEREIEVLRTLKHPNIVRLYDVIETDKYIGIILEYASGGELFDHILAHRYLREKDACKLFSQLISGVWYIHQKKIVHRDLKLENLLLDRNRNVIITDFGFANRFEHRADDLMQTSCGSPCYAAPELVISDGLYVGSAVDIWSCGVILYAMLAGYLPFDDDPANPDGDNINLLYKYIVNTPLSFPDYISVDARDLLSIMLVPDPSRRADLPTIMAHRWLAPYAHIFNKSVDDLERTAMEQHHQKRLAYQRQMKQAAVDANANKISRSHSAAVNGTPSRSHRHGPQPQPEYLYETPADQSVYSTATPSSSRRGVSSAIVLPSSPPLSIDDDPFAPPGSRGAAHMSSPAKDAPMDVVPMDPRPRKDSQVDKPGAVAPTVAPVKSSPDSKRNKGGFRHTIQVEYGEVEEQPDVQPSGLTPAPRRSASGRPGERNVPTTSSQDRRPSKKPIVDTTETLSKPLPVTPIATPQKETPPEVPQPAPVEAPVEPVVAIEVTSPPITPRVAPPAEKSVTPQVGTTSSTESSSSKGRHKRGISIDKMGISKIFSTGNGNDVQANGSISRTSSQKSAPAQASTDAITATAKVEVSRRPSTLQVPPVPTTASTTNDSPSSPLLSPDSASSTKKNRRNTLTVMVEPFKASLKQRNKSRVVTNTPSTEKAGQEKDEPISAAPATAVPEAPQNGVGPPAAPQLGGLANPDVSAVPASTVKASKVMQWFRLKSKGKTPSEVQEDARHRPAVNRLATGLTADSVTVSPVGTITAPTPTAERAARTPFGHPTRSPSGATESSYVDRGLASVLGRVGGHVPPKNVIRVHHGAVDKTAVTTQPPPEVMKIVKKVLEDMGLEIAAETDYKYRCVRPKRKKTAGNNPLKEAGGGLAAFNIAGTAASNGVDKRGLPVPPPSSFGSATGGMLRGLLMRKQSSQVSAVAQEQESPSEAALAAAAPSADAPGIITGEPLYGNLQQDQGDEVRFSVELTRLDRLDDTYSLDIRRLKGNLRSYKFLYDALRERTNLHR